MPIKEIYQGQVHDVPETPRQRPIYTGADGTHWMIVLPGELTLPQHIEGLAKGWIREQFECLHLTMQVKDETKKYKDGSIRHGWYYVGDREKKFIGRSIKPPSAQR